MSMRREVKRILRLLSKHDDIISHAYLDSDYELEESIENDKAINELVAAHIAWRPDDDEPVRLSNAIVTLLNHGTKSVHRSHIDTDIGGRMNELESLIENYRTAKKDNLNNDASVLLRSIREQAHDLSEMLKNTTRQIWRKIDSEFGYVTSIEMKSNENQRVLDQVKQLNGSLELINRAELNRLAGSDWQLRRWLTNFLPRAIETCLAELNDALHRLHDMLFEFKRLQTRGRIVQGFYNHFINNPGYEIQDLSETIHISDYLNEVSGMPMSNYADLEAPHQEPILTDLLVGVRKKQVPTETTKVEKVTVLDEPPEIIDAPVSFLKTKVNDFFSDVIDAGEKSVISMYPLVKHDCEADIWLHAVLEGYNGMLEKEKALFSINYSESQDQVFNGLFHVKDITVTCQV